MFQEGALTLLDDVGGIATAEILYDLAHGLLRDLTEADQLHLVLIERFLVIEVGFENIEGVFDQVGFFLLDGRQLVERRFQVFANVGPHQVLVVVVLAVPLGSAAIHTYVNVVEQLVDDVVQEENFERGVLDFLLDLLAFLHQDLQSLLEHRQFSCGGRDGLRKERALLLAELGPNIGIHYRFLVGYQIVAADHLQVHRLNLFYF